MFPFEHTGEISFQGDGTNNIEQDLIPQNELLAAITLNNPSTANTAKGRGRARGRGRKSWLADVRAGAAGSSSSSGYAVGEIGVNVNAENDMSTKKMIHREIERQRRQEMSGLLFSLRSLLPPPYIKGKRSMSDHIGESVNYIIDLQKNIKELGVHRDNLKTLQDDKSGDGDGRKHAWCSSTTTNACNIAVYRSAVGLQVQILTRLSEHRFALSAALKFLNDEDLEVVSCVSNRANEGFFHNIQCQVNDTTRCIDIDIEQLQQRLYEAV